MGGAAVPFREAATPDRAVVVGGLGETPRNCDEDTIVTARINEIRSLSLMSALRVNSGTPSGFVFPFRPWPVSSNLPGSLLFRLPEIPAKNSTATNVPISSAASNASVRMATRENPH